MKDVIRSSTGMVKGVEVEQIGFMQFDPILNARARFSRLPVEKLSNPLTFSPCASSARAKVDPMKPATPVTR